MAIFRKRSYQEEVMDDLTVSGEVVDQTLRELEIINKRLGGNHVTINGLKKITNGYGKTIRIADLGCGGGDILKLVAKWAKRNNVPCELIGYDANPSIIEYAKKNCSKYSSIRFETKDILSSEFKNEQFDVILCTLFTHHFEEGTLELLFRQFRQQAQLGVIINDLHRHWLAYYSIKLLTQLFSKSAMVKYDAPLSVKRSFRKAELKSILKNAGIDNYQLRWMWAFRWQLIY